MREDDVASKKLYLSFAILEYSHVASKELYLSFAILKFIFSWLVVVS